MRATKRTALVCDDDTMTRGLVSRLLEEAGYDILAELDTAVDVVDVARLSKPDLIVLDLSLPGMSGVAAVARTTQGVARQPDHCLHVVRQTWPTKPA